MHTTTQAEGERKREGEGSSSQRADTDRQPTGRAALPLRSRLDALSLLIWDLRDRVAELARDQAVILDPTVAEELAAAIQRLDDARHVNQAVATATHV